MKLYALSLDYIMWCDYLYYVDAMRYWGDVLQYDI